MDLGRLRIDTEAATETIAAFISTAVDGPGLNGAVIALSGGLDSAVAAFLTARAVGPERLRAYNMPYATSDPDSEAHARLVAEQLGIEFEVIDITPQIDAYFRSHPDADGLRRGNKMARERMSIIYDMAKVNHALVIGTGNRTEAMLGYTTMWGDMAAGIVPIGNLYKTQVRQLAAHLGVPQPIIDKPPSADLWKGQTDEGELGLSYEQADWILYNLLDLQRDPDALASDLVDADAVRKVLVRMDRNSFKRQMPPACDVSACWVAN